MLIIMATVDILPVQVQEITPLAVAELKAILVEERLDEAQQSHPPSI